MSTTAAHVVNDCPDVVVQGTVMARIAVTKIASDAELDLAFLSLETPIQSATLPISADGKFPIGLQVSTWGFPGGYTGGVPLLSVGYLAGVEDHQSKSGKTVRRWVVNAAFNLGNSGGPLVNIETGQVIGVVASKLAPIPPTIKSALEALSKQKSGMGYPATRPDGTTVRLSEGQVIAMVLKHLRSQVQLVVGKAAMINDLRRFIQAQGVEP